MSAAPAVAGSKSNSTANGNDFNVIGNPGQESWTQSGG
jgi:hypothetical protein